MTSLLFFLPLFLVLLVAVISVLFDWLRSNNTGITQVRANFTGSYWFLEIRKPGQKYWYELSYISHGDLFTLSEINDIKVKINNASLSEKEILNIVEDIQLKFIEGYHNLKEARKQKKYIYPEKRNKLI